jgi:competence CoiA-like predicted nuclease
LNGQSLKLLILYNAPENLYSISAHNQTPAEAQTVIEEWQPHLQPGFSFIALDQRKPHAADAAACRACRDAVRRRSGLQPQPKFKRRKS